MTQPVGPPPLLSLIVPTYNERENLSALVSGVMTAVGATPIELIVVDDASPDGTGQAAVELAEQDDRIRLVQRREKGGLAGAVFEGVARARGTWVCVMDADLSHDPEEIPSMLAKAEEGYDLVIGSRYVQGSIFIGQPLPRRAASRLLNLAARIVFQLSVHDVLTGFVLCRRDLLASTPTRFSATGFKWLVEVLATQRPLRVYEWPIVFRERSRGASKAGFRELVTFVVLCARLTAWRVRQALSRHSKGRSP